jgi:hypothetical protein
MTMQTDVKSATCAAGVSTTAFTGRTRLKGLTISFASGSTVVVTDGSGGATLYSFTAPLTAGATNILIPGEGVLAYNGIYVTTAVATTASVFYG